MKKEFSQVLEDLGNEVFEALYADWIAFRNEGKATRPDRFVPGTIKTTDEYKAWKQRYRDWPSKSDEEIRREAAKAAAHLVETLEFKVKTICGEITDANVYFENPVQGKIFLNGTVTGTSGKARVTTFPAGGYNVQQLHVRTRVTEIK